MAKRATEDLSEAVAGPQDWFNDATADVPSSLSLLIDWLGSGNNFEAFKFGVKGKSQFRVATECEAWMRERHCPSPRTYRLFRARYVYPFLCLSSY